jgi:Tol biopolymer transport system component
VLSADGEIVCYVGWGQNPTNSTIPTSVFVWNAETGSNTLINVNLARNGPGNGIADTPRLSADGSMVAFLSVATDLVTNTTSGEFQLYLRDLTRDETRLASVNGQGNASSKGDMLQPSLSADGCRVVFATSDGGLVAGDLNEATDVFMQDPVIGTTELVSVRDPASAPKTGNGASSLNRSALSADGRFVVFTSSANNLVNNDTNDWQDVFARDLSAGTTLLVSANRAGSGSGSGVSYSPAITQDGRFVVFVSNASDLVDNDTNRFEDVFVRDLQTGTTTLVSMNGSGTSSGNGPSAFPAISADGSLVAFLSQATDLATVPLGFRVSLYVRDLRTRITYWAASGGISAPSFSADGRLLTYGISGPFSGLFVWDTQLRTNIATNSVVLASNPIISADGRRVMYELLGKIQIYDIATHSDTPVSLVSSSVDFDAVINGDGNRVAFVSDAPLLPTDTNRLPDVYVFDLPTGVTTLVSINASGTASGNAGSDSPFISNEGRFVAFRSEASDLVSEDTHGAANVFVRDLQTGTTTLLSRNSGSGGNARSSAPVMSGDNSIVAFESLASDLVPSDLNNTVDLFYTRLGLETGGFRLNASFSASDGKVTLQWSTQPSKTYRVQFKHDLNEVVWSELGVAPLEANGIASVIDTSPIRENQRFYRVAELP